MSKFVLYHMVIQSNSYETTGAAAATMIYDEGAADLIPHSQTVDSNTDVVVCTQ
jgi:hypothetical protein